MYPPQRIYLAILATFLFLLTSFSSYGKTFHAIIFANTKNKDIGQSVTVDMERMGVEMTAMAKSIGYTLKKHIYYGSQDKFNHLNLDKVLSDLSCAPDDIVFFYYSGHGGRAENENTEFPEMCLFVNEEDFKTTSQLYPLYDVYARIRKKNPRLTIVMGDMCNSVIEGYYKGNGGTKGATVLSKGVCDVYKNLFVNTKGGIIIASSEPKYTSGCFIFQQDGQWYHAGGYLTHSFLTVLRDFVSKSKNVSWEGLMDATIDVTKYLSKEDIYGNPRRPQVPIYKQDLTIVQSPSENPNVNSTPQAPIVSNDSDTNQQDNLAYSLSMVGNRNVSKLDRIHNIKKALNHFATPQARVQVVGYDNHTIVNTATIEKYLNYLSIASNMDEVVVIDAEKDNTGKIIYVKVHEIHYQ